MKMKLHTKKIIAREFLILIVIVGIGLIAFLLTYPYNLYRHHQVDNLTKDIFEKKQLADSLSSSFDIKTEKQIWLFKVISSKYDLSESQYNSSKKCWEWYSHQAIQDSINIKWRDMDKSDISYFNKIGFNTSDNLQEFIKLNQINNLDLENKKRSKINLKEIDAIKLQKQKNENEILTYYEQVNFGIGILIIFGILLFVLRYIFYAVKWSLKIMKQKSE